MSEQDNLLIRKPTITDYMRLSELIDAFMEKAKPLKYTKEFMYSLLYSAWLDRGLGTLIRVWVFPPEDIKGFILGSITNAIEQNVSLPCFQIMACYNEPNSDNIGAPVFKEVLASLKKEGICRVSMGISTRNINDPRISYFRRYGFAPVSVLMELDKNLLEAVSDE